MAKGINSVTSQRDSIFHFNNITQGEVVDTNDPHQRGRLRVICPILGDDDDTPLKFIPWAQYAAPFAGSVNDITRGREEQYSSGDVSYGMWMIPKVGSVVLIMCVDGDPKQRVWLGCINEQFLSHTMPHGRHKYNKKGPHKDSPSGPLTSNDSQIEPTYGKQTAAFNKSVDTIDSGIPSTPRDNFEVRTRGSDRSVAEITPRMVGSTDSHRTKFADDQEEKFTEKDGNVITNNQGYDVSRIEPDLESGTTCKNYDPQVCSITTPGFHSMSMDDRAENCRVRFRTTHGHQILMDDTNERIYVSTAGGRTWFEMDEAGNIDVYAKRNLSFHAEKDINFTTNKTFRVTATEGIHMISKDEIRIHAKGGDGINIKSEKDIHVESVLSTHVNVGTELRISSGADTHINVGAVGHITTAGILNILSGADTIMEAGPNIHLNGPPATGATPAEMAIESWWTDRIPDHEPWARVMTKDTVTDKDRNNKHSDSAEFQYNDKKVGREERGSDLGRNKNWHR